MTSLASYLKSFGLDAGPTKKSSSRRSEPPSPAQRRSAERASLRHIAGPVYQLSESCATANPPPQREVTPSITMDHSHVKWSPAGKVHFKPGIPADLGLVGKPLTDRKIAQYTAAGRYGLEYKTAIAERAKTKRSKSTGPKPPSKLDTYLNELLGL